jgi:RimJ/RimL family protein N-acetyltransferase
MLFCKPGTKSNLHFEHSFPSGQSLVLRSLILKKDVNILHQWVNEPYAKEFWQLDGPKSTLESTYQSVLKNPDGHSFIGILDEQLVCQIDLYRLQSADLGRYVRHQYNDCGMHLLMAPAKFPVPQLSRMVMETFLRYYFSFSEAENLYAEPDIHNHKACKLLGKSKFSFVQNIMLTDKAASLYLITRKQFHATYNQL